MLLEAIQILNVLGRRGSLIISFRKGMKVFAFRARPPFPGSMKLHMDNSHGSLDGVQFAIILNSLNIIQNLVLYIRQRSDATSVALDLFYVRNRLVYVLIIKDKG